MIRFILLFIVLFINSAFAVEVITFNWEGSPDQTYILELSSSPLEGPQRVFEVKGNSFSYRPLKMPRHFYWEAYPKGSGPQSKRNYVQIVSNTPKFVVHSALYSSSANIKLKSERLNDDTSLSGAIIESGAEYYPSSWEQHRSLKLRVFASTMDSSTADLTDMRVGAEHGWHGEVQSLYAGLLFNQTRFNFNDNADGSFNLMSAALRYLYRYRFLLMEGEFRVGLAGEFQPAFVLNPQLVYEVSPDWSLKLMTRYEYLESKEEEVDIDLKYLSLGIGITGTWDN